jgi:CRISPR type III-A-associated RAMP protein Csm4
MGETKMKLFKLHFSAPVHFATVRKDYATAEITLRSDALYSAIVDVAHKQKLLSKNNNSNFGFYLTSSFPFYQKDEQSKTYYFFPRPFMVGIKPPDELSKKWKKVKWIEKSFFEKIIAGNSSIEISENCINDEFLIPPEIKNELSDGFILKEEQPKVKVGAAGQESEPYYLQRIYFKGKSGLFFIVFFENEVAENLFQNAMTFLQHEGLGSYRTIGFGQFDYTAKEIVIMVNKNKINKKEEQEEENEKEIKFFFPERDNYWCTLSLFCPENKEQLSQMLTHASWQLVKRGGWISNYLYKYRKKNLMMFAEGSIFQIPDSMPGIFFNDTVKILGEIYDVSPGNQHFNISHPIYRYGKGFFIPVKA